VTPSGPDIAAAYDAWHAGLPPDEGADSPWHEQLKALLFDLTGYQVLEIGCGRGGFTAWLATCQPLGIVAADFSTEAVTKARTLEPAGTSFIVADIERIPLRTGSLDMVISCETVEHVPCPPAAIAEMARLLRPGGRLYLTTPNYLSMTGIYRVYVRLTGRHYTEVGQPINQLTLIPRVGLWIRRAGLRTVRMSSVGHYIPWPGRRPVRLYCLDLDRLPLRWLGLHSVFVAERPREPR
jgi:ubiquinone/menaquinone biosynthesis C-methylase UbiE